ncbi:DUF3558 domain-containing protein [Amycolatopsis dendrobii]|uniref:DUF3558 domain-containing protein n=1 Tax=Amycolatopsis dendrobii TaxID=2760662 RepID=A0A7W3W306_9PSEU|nr:DUF3558 domain-containing protein [Amycolatopsis dendrobii]MBB1157825.1 DUF3558 domain-containing protein [Amycolatopsis dendrobii]
MKPIATAAGAASILLVLTACSSPNGGQPAPASSNPPASSSNAASDVPKVPNPLDVAKYEQDPCSVLTQAQAAQAFNAVRNRKIAGNVAPVCTWNDSENSSLAIGLLPGQGGLATVYKNRSSTGYFEPAPSIDGYPAVFTNVLDNRSDGGCQVAVGVRADEAFTSSVILFKQSPSYGDPCSVALKAAGAALATIKAGA